MRIKNAIVASCWTYFTNIKHDARNHKYKSQHIGSVIIVASSNSDIVGESDILGCDILLTVVRLDVLTADP